MHDGLQTCWKCRETEKKQPTLEHDRDKKVRGPTAVISLVDAQNDDDEDPSRSQYRPINVLSPSFKLQAHPRECRT